MSAEKIGRYEVIRELGRGGMAVVYLAYDPFFDRQVALKIISNKLADDPQFEQFRARFQREAKVIAALEHASIVPVYDYGEEAGQPFLVMRYMTGGTLADRIGGQSMSLAQAVPVVQRVAEALHAAHRRGIVHRDLKPGNVLFDADGHAFLSDFGIAKLQSVSQGTSTLGIVGTFGYMSPEQAQGNKEIDARSDIYSLGVMLYEMLTGQQPYQSDTPVGLALKHVTEPAPALNAARRGLPEECDAILLRALAKKPEDRYATAIDLSEDLSAAYATLLATQPGAASDLIARTIAARLAAERPTVPSVRAEQPKPATRPAPSRRFPVALVAGGVIGVALLVGAALIVLNQFAQTNQAARATETALALIVIPTETSPPAATAIPTGTAPPAPTGAPLPTETPPPAATAIPAQAASPTLGPGATAVSAVDGMVMVFVPAGEFYMGASGDSDPNTLNNEKPQRLVNLSAFWIDQTEVTNAQYQQCLDAGACSPPGSARFGVEAYLDHPVVGVSWTQAQAYCDWAGGRLPTEAEWEKAARGPAEGAGPKRIYPWGNKTPAADLANFNRNVGGTREVGQYPPGASPYGALDMAGNAAEWVADWFGDLYYSEASAAGINTDPPGPASGQYRVIRGGSHLSEARAIRVAYRDRNTERFQSGYIGFRCARPEP